MRRPTLANWERTAEERRLGFKVTGWNRAILSQVFRARSRRAIFEERFPEKKRPDAFPTSGLFSRD